MGCTQSKIENEEAVSRCKDRRQFMKDSVASRNAFAAAHSAYAMSLKHTGAALSDYASGEVPQSSIFSSAVPGSTSVAAVIPSTASATVDNLPPPPPLPSFAETPPLQRAVSMPELKIQKPPDGKAPMTEPIIEEEEEEDEEIHENESLVRRGSNRGGSGGGRGDRDVELPPIQQQQRQPPRRRDEETMRSQPAQMMQQDYMEYWFPPVDSIHGPSLADPIPEEEFVGAKRNDSERNTFHSTWKISEEDMEEHNEVVEEVEEKPIEVPVLAVDKNVVKKEGGGGGRRVGKVLNLLQVFSDLDDHFLKASESAHEVSKMLEATRLHYHSNFADNRGHIDHSARVMRVITWNRSFRGIPNVDNVKDDFDSEEHETHATVLDKMLAWEKKLYDEVKANEIMKVVYQKKVATLNKLKKRNPNSESLEKLKAAVSHLHTRYIVDMQSMDSTVSEINRLRDEQLYPKLVQLVDGMAIMWETMRVEHETQSNIVNTLRSLDISQSPNETSEHHHERTFQLWVVVQEWHSQFCKLIDNQKAYIKSLNNWLKLNLIPIESSLKEKVSSPPRIRSPPIRALLIAWHDHLEKLPDEVARSAINNFAAAINTIFQHQKEEMKLKEKCEQTQKELIRKERQFDDWYNKYMQQRTPEELDFENEDNNPHKEAIAERQYIIDQLKQQLKNEKEENQKQCLQVREKSLASLKTRLPELFRAMSDISFACSGMYRNLRSISQRPIRD